MDRKLDRHQFRHSPGSARARRAGGDGDGPGNHRAVGPAAGEDDPVEVSRRRFAAVETRVLSVAGEGPTIVLFHGFSDSADTWRSVLEHLAARGRRAVAVDLPGHGLATMAHDGPVLPQIRAFTVAVARAFPGAILAGNSLGGLGVLLAGEDPDLPAAGLVALGPAGLGFQPWLSLAAPILRPVVASTRLVPTFATRLALARLFFVLAVRRRPSREVVARYASHARSRPRLAGLLRMAVGLRTEALPGCLDLQHVDLPVLLLWGRHDRLVPLSGAEVLRADRPDARVVVFDDCGHCPQIEAPRRVTDELVAFAERWGRE